MFHNIELKLFRKFLILGILLAGTFVVSSGRPVATSQDCCFDCLQDFNSCVYECLIRTNGDLKPCLESCKGSDYDPCATTCLPTVCPDPY